MHRTMLIATIPVGEIKVNGAVDDANCIIAIDSDAATLTAAFAA